MERTCPRLPNTQTACPHKSLILLHTLTAAPPQICSEEEKGGRDQKKSPQTSGALPLFEKCHKETRRIRKCQVWYVKESSITQSFDNYAVKRVPEKQQLNWGRGKTGGGRSTEMSAHTHTHSEALWNLTHKVWDISNLPDVNTHIHYILQRR